MVIKINLSIPNPSMSRSKAKAEAGIKYYIIFAAAAAYLLTAFAVLLLGFWKIYLLHGEKLEIVNSSRVIANNVTVMDKEYKRLLVEASTVDFKLDFMLGDTPSIEILTLLDSLLPEGVTIESVNITPLKAIFEGVALREGDALQFVNNLSSAAFVVSVDIPDIKSIQLKGAKVTSFSVECTIRPIRDILGNSVF